MSDIVLTQDEADALMEMEKQCAEDKDWLFPDPGDKLVIPITSLDRRENFLLDITRGRIKLTQATYQNRARQSVVLRRLDIDGPPHTNPDGEEMACPHLHIYRAGYGTKWAYQLPAIYAGAEGLNALFTAFVLDCRITGLRMQWGLFS